MSNEIEIRRGWIYTKVYIVESDGNDNLNIPEEVRTAEFRFLPSEVVAFYQVESEECDRRLGKTVIYIKGGEDFTIDIFFKRFDEFMTNKIVA